MLLNLVSILRGEAHSAQSSFWVEASPKVYQAFPYHILIQPNRDDLFLLFNKHKAIAIRYSTPLNISAGIASYHVVLTDKSYSLSSINKKARYDVRKGLKFGSIEPIPIERLAVEGWELRLNTLERQKRVGSENQERWQNFCLSMRELGGFEIWGSIVGNKLVASLVSFIFDDCYSILYQQSLTKYLGEGINNALTYIVTNEVMSRSNINQIFYGLHSLDAPPSVDEFKFRMGYRAKLVRQQVVFHPYITPLINNVSHAVVRNLLHLKPGNPILSKAEGMLRFYLEGKKPLQNQKWPEAIQHLKSQFVS